MHFYTSSYRSSLARLGLLCGASLAAIVTGAPSAMAQTASGPAQLEEVVVTAERRTTNVQETATSIAVVAGQELVSQGVTQLDDALKGLAGIAVSQGPTGLDATIRGIGPSLPVNIGGDAGISTTYDGVYSAAAIASRTGYYDLARIEVLRGPQGTLYGRNAEGGALNIISNNPSQEYEGSVSATIGNYDLTSFTGMVNLPVTDALALRVAAIATKRDGYLSNGQDDNDAVGLRVKALYKPTDALTVLGGLEYFAVQGKGPGTVTAFVNAPSADRAYVSPRPTDQQYERDGYKLWSQIDLNLGFGQLTVIPAYQFASALKQRSFTGLTSAVAPGQGHLEQSSLEVRLASASDARFEWIVGAYYYDNEDAALNQRSAIASGGTVIANPTSAPSNVITQAESLGVFAQVKIPVADRLKVVAGIRHSDDEKSQYRTATMVRPVKARFDQVDWKLGLEYKPSDDVLLYATAATGYRPGGISPAPPNPQFDSETLMSYEAGIKSDLFAKRLRLNGSLYYYKYENYQVPNLTPSAFGLELLIANLPEVVNWGGELEAQWLLTDADRVSASVAYLNSEVKRPYLIRLPPPGTQVNGQPLPNSPEWTLSASYEHDFDLGAYRLTPSATARYSDEYYVTIPRQPLSIQKAYWETDLSLGLRPIDGDWKVNAFVRNLSEEVVKSNYIGGNMTLASPRTYGVSVTANF